MLTLTLTNTLTRKKEPLIPITPGKVGLYVCGITPYDHSHIGHARANVAADVLFRTLRRVYGAENVNYVRNFTDIDDKIIARAAETGQDPKGLSQTFIESFQEDMKALGALTPTHEPRVSDAAVMEGIVDFITQLMQKGAAYIIENDGVYLDLLRIDALKNKEETYQYGQLSGKKLDELLAGARVDVNIGKRNSGDFALWKLAKPGEPFWPSPWGNGRPGWHIECSVMSAQLLGDRFDIHGGGEDLQFPHHENELAQSVACHGHIHANVWVHNGFITVGGTKMSKSLGNFTLIKDVLAHTSGAAMRLWLMQTHYRKPVDYSDAAVKGLEKPVRRIKAALETPPTAAPDAATMDAFWAALCDDLNTAKALATLNTTLAKQDDPAFHAAIHAMADVLLGSAA